MMVIIVGANRAELYKVKRSDQDKHFIQSKGQLYKVYPEGLRRMRIYDSEGNERESEEVVVYGENQIVPYHPGTVDYTSDRILAEIDGHKEARGGPNRATIRAVSDAWRDIKPMLPMLIAVVAVGWAFLTG